MPRWFIRFPEFVGFNEFPSYLGKTPLWQQPLEKKQTSGHYGSIRLPSSQKVCDTHWKCRKITKQTEIQGLSWLLRAIMKPSTFPVCNSIQRSGSNLDHQVTMMTRNFWERRRTVSWASWIKSRQGNTKPGLRTPDPHYSLRMLFMNFI